MSASMAEEIADALGDAPFAYNEFDSSDEATTCIKRSTSVDEIAEYLAAAGYGKLEDSWEDGLDAGCDRWMDFREFGDKPTNPYRQDAKK